MKENRGDEMTNDVMTYETLYELLRKEKYNQDIQELNKDFFKEVIKYLEEKERLVRDTPETSAFSKEAEATKKQIENAKRIMKELYERRELKIMQLGMLSSRSGKKIECPLLPEEEKLYAEIYATVEKYRKNVLESVLNVRQPIIKEEPPKTIKTEKGEAANKLVRFVRPTPKFVSPDLKIYGPFEKEDMGCIPEKVADALIKKKCVEEIKSEEK